MNILVVFATKTGVSEDLAVRLKETCKHELSVMRVNDCTRDTLLQADAIVLGAGVYIGKLHRKMRGFIKKHASVLLEKPLLMYICAGEPEENMDDVLTVSMPERVKAHAANIFHTGGQFRFDRMKPWTRWIIKAVQKNREDAAEPAINESSVKALISAVDTL